MGNFCDCEVEKSEDKPYEILVVTSDQSWGKADTLIQAMKNAYVNITTKQVIGYVGKDLTCHGTGCVSGSKIINLGDLAFHSLFDRGDLIEAVQKILDDLKGHDRLTCMLEEIKEVVWLKDEEARNKKETED